MAGRPTGPNGPAPGADAMQSQGETVADPALIALAPLFNGHLDSRGSGTEAVLAGVPPRPCLASPSRAASARMNPS
jgi:hypothetical protein